MGVKSLNQCSNQCVRGLHSDTAAMGALLQSSLSGECCVCWTNEVGAAGHGVDTGHKEGWWVV